MHKHATNFFCSFFLIIVLRFVLNHYPPYPLLPVALSWQKKSALERKIVVERACGFKHIVANMYWLHLLLHSDQLITPAAAPYVHDLTTLITDLDPHHNVVYRSTALWLMTRMNHPAYALDLLHKSLQSSFNRDDWRIYFLLAYGTHFFNHDAHGAGEYLALAHERCAVDHTALLKADRAPMPHYLRAWQKRLQGA